MIVTTSEIEALARATRNNEVELIEQLIRDGVNPNDHDQHGETALTLAIKEALSMQRSYEFATVQTLLRHKANPNVRNANGEHPLLLALNHRLVPDRKILRPSSTKNDPAGIVCKLLIESGADVNAVEEDETTALMISMVARSSDTVWQLLSRGADVKASNKNGGTALMCSVAPYRAVGQIIPRLTCGIQCSGESKPMGSAEEVSALLEKGADPRASIKQGKDAFELARMAVPSYTDLLALFGDASR